MVYMHRTGSSSTTTTNTFRAIRRGRNSIFCVSAPEAFLLTWLIYGLVPLTLTAGIGSNDMTTIGPTLFNRQTNNLTPTTPNKTPTSSTVNSSKLSTENTNEVYNNFYYNCPTSCQCEYSSSSQKLEIRCSLLPITRSEEDISSSSSTTKRLDLSPGVRILRISQVLLDAKSLESVIGSLPLKKDTLQQLDLEQVNIELKSFFTCSLFRESQASLRQLSITRGNVRGDAMADYSASSLRDLLRPLASLQSMDSLNICDSSPNLATIVLQAMPAVKHLRAVNNSLYDIPYESLTSPHQYSIQSIDFSRNHLALLSRGLLEGLRELHSLDVSHNRIFHLQEQIFTGLKSLRKLNVSHNKIEYVDAEVFTPLPAIQTVDLSHNEVVQFFEPYFGNNKKLEILNMSNMWVSGTFTTSETARRSLMETEQLISTLQRLEKLDISANGMINLPETLTHAPNLLQVHLEGNKWECTCHDRWFVDWVATSPVTIGDNNSTDNVWCYSRRHNGETERYPFHQFLKNLSKTCTNQNIIARTPCKFSAVMGNDKQLKCHAQKPHWPKITWITPSKKEFSFDGTSNNINHSGSSNSEVQSRSRGLREPRVAADGSLYLRNVTGVDYGLYLCIASYEDLNITHYVHLGMDVSIFRDVRLVSIIVGWTFSFSFLAIVLIAQLVRCILHRLGFRCVTVATAKQTRRVRAFFDSMEQNKNSQLDWLRDNYNMQAKKIKENCYSQLERIRESYATQSKSLGGIRDFGTQQLHTLRDQYNDQVRRVANYSAHQLCKVRENYVFKRNQVCKFSNHQLLRLRETYKWQAQTLNKILENLPRGLNFDTCRGMGACGRTDSIYLSDMGDEFGEPLSVDPEMYKLSHHKQSMSDKMEHVSLLIPPEFMAEYNARISAAYGIDNENLVRGGDECDLERDLGAETLGRENLIEAIRMIDEEDESEVTTVTTSFSSNTPPTASSCEPSSSSNLAPPTGSYRITTEPIPSTSTSVVTISTEAPRTKVEILNTPSTITINATINESERQPENV